MRIKGPELFEDWVNFIKMKNGEKGSNIELDRPESILIEDKWKRKTMKTM